MAFYTSFPRHIPMATICLALAACGGSMSMGMHGPKAVADLESTRGSTVTGTATFTQDGDRVMVTADIRGLPANALVGFHIHDKGDCSSGDGMSAGGHFNPLKKPHGHEGAERHAGDMPNLQADATGHALYHAELDVMTVTEGPASIIGRGLIVHRDIDDYTTQPTGNAGPRMACGVIRAG
jgi:Cu-Zn family superoxide dismutase